jgi:hypothetical protein
MTIYKLTFEQLKSLINEFPSGIINPNDRDDLEHMLKSMIENDELTIEEVE